MADLEDEPPNPDAEIARLVADLKIRDAANGILLDQLNSAWTERNAAQDENKRLSRQVNAAGVTIPALQSVVRQVADENYRFRKALEEIGTELSMTAAARIARRALNPQPTESSNG